MAKYGDLKAVLETQLEELKKMGKSRRAVEADLGYSEHYLDQVLSKGGNKKVIDAVASYKDKLEEDGAADDKTMANSYDGGLPYAKNVSDKEISMQAILSLTRSNEKLANANADLSRSNLELTQLITRFANTAIETSSASPATVADLLVLIAEVGSGKRWHSVDEALAALNKRFFDTQRVGSLSGTQSGSGN